MDLIRARKRAILCAVLLAAALLLTGCRTRTGDAARPPAGAGDTGTPDGAMPGTEPADTVLEEDGEPGGETRENPTAPRKEYDENAPAEVTEGTDRLLHAAGTGEGAPVPEKTAPDSAVHADGNAADPATQTVPSGQADALGASEDGEAAESALLYYTVLLRDRLDTLFECKKPDLYWETPEDHVTVHKSSPEHRLILDCGTYDVSARLLPENLRVDDGWVVRKNPGVIVKVVDGAVLGSGQAGTQAARQVYDGMAARPGWAGIDAVRSGRVLLLSSGLFATEWQRTAAMLLIARTAHGDLFADTDVDEALRVLAEEEAGGLPAGTWYWRPDHE